ncbi:hypothetical protein CDV36_016250 [Fusarium kuroshium]|uniref:VOC domain-containing protein n=1 Tax=Fusarium kuroshium TaxID=2010991 RepID=A0A3M2QWA6_9HYPO|nr:hypothetical protein CDV36_016250 [Fusarium kuroshium]
MADISEHAKAFQKNDLGYDEVGDTVLRPHYFAHVVLRTAKYLPMRNFYKTFLGGHATYENEKLCFITYDEEHHRVAIINLADTGPKIASSAGLELDTDCRDETEHIAYAFKSLEDLAVAYRQRKARGIVPVWSVNHGPTTSMYYKDPDGNKIEVQVDNFDTVQETTEFFHTKEFAENPIGVDFDPEDLIRRLRSGEDPKAIMKRPNIGPRTSFNRP